MCLEIVLNPYSLCSDCFNKIDLFPNYANNLSSAIVYNEKSSQLFLRFKYHDECELAHFFAKLMYNCAPYFFFETDIITGVPLHPTRLAFRKYNQATLLARAVLKLLSPKKIFLDPCLLKRTRNTPFQDKNRDTNVKNAFSCDVSLKNKNILLIDDVYASGSTVNECKKALKKTGANNIYILTAGRVLS